MIIWTFFVGLLYAVYTTNKETIIQYNILSYGENISLSLGDYLETPKQSKIDFIHSSKNIDSLDYTNLSSNQPIVDITSIPLNISYTNGSTFQFDDKDILVESSIYNQPNKIYLMKNNIILLIRYQFTPSDVASTVTITEIPTASNCTQMGTIGLDGSYFLIVGCLKNNSQVNILAYRFSQSSPGVLQGLVFLNEVNASLTNCSKITMYSFRRFNLYTLYNNSILLFCSWKDIIMPLQSYPVYFLNIAKVKGSSYLVVTPPQRQSNLATCLDSSFSLLSYEQGLLIQKINTLYYYKYGNNQSSCNEVMPIQGMAFMDLIEDQGIQYVYLLFNNKIIIKQSYSPNFQTFEIKGTQNLTLYSYAIGRKFLILKFGYDSQTIKLWTFNMINTYPKDAGQLFFNKADEFYIYSVHNFLESGNYYFTFNKTTNELLLRYYQGYQFYFSVKDPKKQTSHVTINISNQLDDHLIINCSIINFENKYISQNTNLRNLSKYRQILNVNLLQYLIGPLGKFYNYPNTISAFQYINQYSQANIEDIIKQYERPIAISFNNYLDSAVINFYYSFGADTCQLFFNTTSQASWVSQCKQLKRKKSSLEIPKEILILGQDRYLQYDSKIIEYCLLSSSSNQFECYSILNTIQIIASFDRIYVACYHNNKNNQRIDLVLHNETDIAYIYIEKTQFKSSNFAINILFHTNINSFPNLATWTINKLLVDPGYQQFMILHLKKQQLNRVVVFNKPIRNENSTTFIGYILQIIDVDMLDGVFLSNNLLVLLYIQGNKTIIQQYKITKYFKLRQTRIYPMYDYNVVVGGDHQQDQNYIYIQCLDKEQSPIYLVYNPSGQTHSVLTHKFQKMSKEALVFAQQLGKVDNNSMSLNGNTIVAITNPSLLFKIDVGNKNIKKYTASQNSIDNGMVIEQINVSFIDEQQIMSIIDFKFDYEEGQQKIKFLGDTTKQIILAKDSAQSQSFSINSQFIYGPINDYNITLESQLEQCIFFQSRFLDIFTRQKCLLYQDTNKFGKLNDFLALYISKTHVQILKTDRYLLCIANRQINKRTVYSSQNLTQCKFQQVSTDQVLMTCKQIGIINKVIYLLRVSVFGERCMMTFNNIALPNWLNYDDFQVNLLGNNIIFEVPIRYMQNCIYYKGTLKDQIYIDDNYSILVVDGKLQSEVSAIDTSFYEELFLILSDGIRVYNVTNSISALQPALQITPYDFSNLPITKSDYVYIKCINYLAQNGSINMLIQLGTEQSSYEIEIVADIKSTNTYTQSSYKLTNMTIMYEYKQYVSCHNSLQSQSQKYQNFIIKICNYEPPEQLVFSNFISIANNTAKSLIQFYNRTRQNSYPIRIETIYYNFESHHSFMIREDTLIVASLFNMLCYYRLSEQLKWVFSLYDNDTLYYHNNSINKDTSCKVNIILQNQLYSQKVSLNITFDYDEKERPIWSEGIFYIQRVVLLIILINSIRIIFSIKGSKNKFRLKKRLSTRQYTNRFQVMLKINSKKST